MQWTQEIPAQEGIYWVQWPSRWQFGGGDMEMVEIVPYSIGLATGLRLHGFGWSHKSTLDEEKIYEDAWWQGPLDVPYPPNDEGSPCPTD